MCGVFVCVPIYVLAWHAIQEPRAVTIFQKIHSSVKTSSRSHHRRKKKKSVIRSIYYNNIIRILIKYNVKRIRIHTHVNYSPDDCYRNFNYIWTHLKCAVSIACTYISIILPNIIQGKYYILIYKNLHYHFTF